MSQWFKVKHYLVGQGVKRHFLVQHLSHHQKAFGLPWRMWWGSSNTPSKRHTKAGTAQWRRHLQSLSLLRGLQDSSQTHCKNGTERCLNYRFEDTSCGMYLSSSFGANDFIWAISLCFSKMSALQCSARPPPKGCILILSWRKYQKQVSSEIWELRLRKIFSSVQLLLLKNLN